MPVSRALRRLLRIRELEEEQSRLALESALGEMHRLEHALTTAAHRDREGRRLIAASAHNGELPDRLAGAQEISSAAHLAQHLRGRKQAVEQQAMECRELLLARRVERRQAETLIDKAKAAEAIETGRKEQQALDDRHRTHSLPAAKRLEAQSASAQACTGSRIQDSNDGG